MRLDFPGVTGSGEIWMEVMRAICGDTTNKSMVDLGAHKAPYTPLLGFNDRTYVDIQKRELDFKQEQQFFVQSDMLIFLKRSVRSFDVAIASDSIEHLTKLRGYALIGQMILASRKQILFTPIGPYNLNANDGPDGHKSGWYPEDFYDEFAIINFPDFHPQLDVGAFFAFHCEDLKQEFTRVKNELKNKSWTK